MLQPDAPLVTQAGGRPRDDLPRHRLVRRVLDLLEEHGAVVLLASAGWGKSSLARAVAAQFDGSVHSASRIDLTGARLAEAVQRLRTQGTPALLVIDDAECLAGDDEAATVLAALSGLSGQAERGGVAVLLCTSQAVGRLLDDDVPDEDGLGVPVLTPTDLRFSTGEVEELRSRSVAASPLPATEVMRLTGGWPRGAWAAVQLDARNPRTLDLLDDAIESSVLGALSAPERDFLLHVSALAPVDRGTAVGVLGEDADRLWREIDQRRLPLASFEEDRIALRRPLLDYLRSELAREQPGLTATLRAAYLQHLRSSGRVVEVIDWHLDRGSRSEALKLIAHHVRSGVDPAVVEPDFDRWTTALGVDALLAQDATAGMMIQILHRRGQTEQAAILAQQLIDDGRMDAILDAEPSLRPIVVYVLHNRPQVALQLLPEARGSYALGAFAYSVAATGGTEPVEPPDRAEWGDLSIHVIWGMLWQGRLVDALEAMTEDGTITDSSSSLVLAALWSDKAELAEEAYRLVPKADGYPWAQFAHAAIALYKGEFDKGLRILGGAMPAAQRTQAAPTFETLASYLTFKAGDAERAIRSLESRLPQHSASGRHAIAEWAQLILALGYLDRDRPEDAARVLEEAMAAMEQAERLLLLAAARIAYAETQARAGLPADVLRQLLSAAGTAPAGIGSSYWEREARSQARELHRLGLLAPEPAGRQATTAVPAPAPSPSVAAAASSVRLSAFEKPPVLEIDGVRHPLGRTKLAELVADLAVHGGAVDRAALQVRLFPDVGQRSAGNHFRQVLFKLRELTGIVLDRPSRNEIGWPSPQAMTSSDVEFENRMHVLLADERTDVTALRSALDLVQGHYLSSSELAWVVERRQLLNLLFEEGVARLLRHPVSSRDLDLVREYGHRALVLSPYSEDIYRLMIEAELERGSAARARAIHRRAVHAMKDLGLEPSGEIRVLARRVGERLRAEQADQAAQDPAPSV